MRTSHKIAALIAPLALFLAACSTNDNGTITQPESETVAVEQSGNETEVVEEETVEVEPAKTNPEFGDTYTWPDGLSVTVSAPEEITLSNEYAAEVYDLEVGPVVGFTITLHNGTDEDFESMNINAQMTSGSKQAEPVFEVEQGISMPTSTVLPGNDLTWKVGYVVSDPEKLQLTLSDMGDYNRDKVHFVN